MTDFKLDPPPNFEDPRMLPGFQRIHYPLCGGMPAASPDTTDPYELRCLEFLAAYYAINAAQAELLEDDDPTPEQRTAHQLAVAALEALEDRDAAIGFYGEPVMDGVHYRDIHFSRPGLHPGQQTASTLSSHIAVPWVEEIPLTELIGPAITVRWPIAIRSEPNP